jgi:hypothetical protein
VEHRPGPAGQRHHDVAGADCGTAADAHVHGEPRRVRVMTAVPSGPVMMSAGVDGIAMVGEAQMAIKSCDWSCTLLTYSDPLCLLALSSGRTGSERGPIGCRGTRCAQLPATDP